MTLPNPLISRSESRLGGEPCFSRTRVPAAALFDHLTSGGRLADFVRDYPDVSSEHAIAVLRLASERVLGDVQRSPQGSN